MANIATVTGNLLASSSVDLTGNTIAATASFASTASQAISASWAPTTPSFPFTGSAQITGSLGVTGSTNLNGILSVGSTSTNNLASFTSVEPNINIVAIGSTNSAALFLSPSAGYNGGIHNRTGGGLEFYTGVTPSVAMTINASGNTIANGSVSANLGFTGSLFGTASQATALQNTGSTGFVSNMGDTYAGTAKITNIVTLTAAEYSGIGSPASDTLYVVI